MSETTNLTTEEMAFNLDRAAEAVDGLGLKDIARGNRALAQRLRDLQAIVDRLPVTADGVPVTPGMHLWFPSHWREGCAQDGESREFMDAMRCASPVSNRMVWMGHIDSKRGSGPHDVHALFSTPEAAQAAGKGE